MKNKNMCTLEELNLQAAMLKGKGDLEGVIRLAEANSANSRAVPDGRRTYAYNSERVGNR